MINFDIMTTATLRPDLLKQTFDSHLKNLFGDHIRKARLIINIDLIGSNQPEKDLQRVLDIIGNIPFRERVINICDKPSFSRVFYWCLGQLDSPLTFVLEEDWLMRSPMSFEKMVQHFMDDSDLAHLRLSCFKSVGDGKLKTWNKFCPWNGEYFEVTRDLRGTIGWAGHPSLNRTAFLMFFRTIINPEANPEKQIKGAYPIILNSRFGVFHPQKSPPVIEDIGRKWMVENGYRKAGVKAHFTEWEKTDET